MDALRTVALLAATLATGMMAGLFYAYSCSVMPALRRAPAAVLVETMQQVNRAILNGWFFLCYVGALLAGAVAVLVAALDGDTGVLVPAVLGLALYAAQVVVTSRVNIPLNNALDAAGSADPEATRAAFEQPWTKWNNLRTLLCLAAFAAWCGALIQL